MVVNGKSDWLVDLKRMWTEAFGDEEEAVELFYHCFFTEENTWCYCTDGVPVSVIYTIPALLWMEQPGQKHNLTYLYAGTTRSDCQGRGYYGRLIRQVVREQNQNTTAVLMPVGRLIPYYQKLGFSLLLNQKDMFLTPDMLRKKELSPRIRILQDTITGSRYKQIRDQRLGRPGYIEWDEKYLSYAIHAVMECGGIAAELEIDSQPHIMLAKPMDGYLKVIETSLNREQLIRWGALFLGQHHIMGLCLAGNSFMSAGGDWPFLPYFKIGLDD